MPIQAKCQCGKTYVIKDEFEGRRAKCSACGHVFQISRCRLYSPPRPAALDHCQSLINDVAGAHSPDERSRALQLLKSSNYPYFEKLVQFIKKPEGTVTFEYVSECLARDHDVRIFQPLVDILTPWLEHKPCYEALILRSAARALGLLGDARAVHVLTHVLRSNEQPLGSATGDAYTDCVREAAAEALGIIGDNRAVPALRRALDMYTATFDPFAPDSRSSKRFVSTEGLAVAVALGKLNDRESANVIRGLRNCGGASMCGNFREKIDRIVEHLNTS